MNKPSKGLDYRAAGVNIDAGNQLASRIKKLAKPTYRSQVKQGIGGFAALFELPIHEYKQPLLVSCTDGVGTKLKLAIETGLHGGIGEDLVAMCVNDLAVCGAEPLFFLDYYATGKLNVAQAEVVIASIAKACKKANVSLIGGETAEMPGMYQGNDYDLAGFCVGIVEEEQLIDGSQVQSDDVLLGLASSGPHSNGYSLIRRILELGQHSLEDQVAGRSLSEWLLQATRIYSPALLALSKERPIHAMAHITGGGLLDNIPRVLPETMKAVLDHTAWPRPDIFAWLQQQGEITDEEMYRTFNCGIGMVLCLPQQHIEEAQHILQQQGESSYVIGQIETRNSDESACIIT